MLSPLMGPHGEVAQLYTEELHTRKGKFDCVVFAIFHPVSSLGNVFLPHYIVTLGLLRAMVPTTLFHSKLSSIVEAAAAATAVQSSIDLEEDYKQILRSRFGNAVINAWNGYC